MCFSTYVMEHYILSVHLTIYQAIQLWNGLQCGDMTVWFIFLSRGFWEVFLHSVMGGLHKHRLSIESHSLLKAL